MIVAFSIAGLLLSIIPAAMFWSNLPLFLLPDEEEAFPAEADRRLSVLIPARDEEATIEATIRAALASRHLDVEVVVLDDHSSDRTGKIVRGLAEANPRLRYLPGKPLPDGWNGKQHACLQLAQSASHETMVFLDADVRLQPEGLVRLIRHQARTSVALLSAFPHQETGTVLEKWIIPLMHYVLLGFLPLARMRASKDSAFAAGCGQLFMTGKAAYQDAGTHETIRSSRHDGLTLPRAYRRAGLSTDVVDGTELAECRMYHSASEVVRGVLKNATEGIASRRLIVPFSVLLLGSSVIPLVTLFWAASKHHWTAFLLSAIGVTLGHLPRAIAAIRFRQPALGVFCHGLSILVFLGLQWLALGLQMLGRKTAWRGRTES